MSEHPTLTCELCGLVFQSDWSEAEAKAEAVKVFGGPIPEGADATVCEDCYLKVMVKAGKEDWPKQWVASGGGREDPVEIVTLTTNINPAMKGFAITVETIKEEP